MPLDHYIPQVHLKNFYSSVLQGEKMFGCRKRDGLIFPCQAKEVCRIENGSTNEYLLQDRAIEDFLKAIEPNYNESVAALRNGKFNKEDIFVIAGFAAFVTSCSPTAMRLGSNPLKSIVESTTTMLDQMGHIPNAPDELGELGGKSISELLNEGSVVVRIDEKYPQAMGISQILERVGIWGNSRWELIHNNFVAGPFFTSDFASAVEPSLDNRILNRLFPLTPDFAVRIHPNFEAKEVRGDRSFPNFGFRITKASHDGVRAINRAIVQCAEELVFFRDRADWVKPFLDKNRMFWVEPVTDKIPLPEEGGDIHIFRMRIGRKPGH